MAVTTDTSFYRLPKVKQIKPKIFFEKDSLRAEGDGVQSKQNQTNLLQGGKQLRSEPKIEHEDIRRLWKTANYNKDDEPFKRDRLITLAEINKYYAPGKDFVPHSVALPPFDPTDKITLNTESGLESQWRTYVSKTGKKK